LSFLFDFVISLFSKKNYQLTGGPRGKIYFCKQIFSRATEKTVCEGGRINVHCVKKSKCKKLQVGGGVGGKMHSVYSSCVKNPHVGKGEEPCIV
jgi:hypothetical protein